jgi:uncharacterized protein YdeI (BOF family)
MKKMSIIVTMFVVVLGVRGGDMTHAAESTGPAAPGSSAGGGFGGADETLRGEVLLIDGDKYIVRDSSGNKVSFRVNEQTKMEVSPQVGEKIEAILSEGGQAKLVKKGTVSPGSGTPSSKEKNPSPVTPRR